MGHADVFVVDGAAHSAASHNGTSIGIFGRGISHGLKGFTFGFGHWVLLEVGSVIEADLLLSV